MRKEDFKKLLRENKMPEEPRRLTVQEERQRSLERQAQTKLERIKKNKFEFITQLNQWGLKDGLEAVFESVGIKGVVLRDLTEDNVNIDSGYGNTHYRSEDIIVNTRQGRRYKIQTEATGKGHWVDKDHPGQLGGPSGAYGESKGWTTKDWVPEFRKRVVLLGRESLDDRIYFEIQKFRDLTLYAIRLEYEHYEYNDDYKGYDGHVKSVPEVKISDQKGFNNFLIVASRFLASELKKSKKS